jgi:hypothetical protein
MSFPRYAEPMCGWPNDAVTKDCGCVRDGKRWHTCSTHSAEIADELSEHDD